MNRLVAAVMLVALAVSVIQLARRSAPTSYAVLALVSCATPIGLALIRIVPNAMRLGTRADTVAVQSELARSICREHVFSAVAIAIFLGLQLVPWNRKRP
jgi:hypothetical protein